MIKHNKHQLIDFINKCHLNGNVESIKINVLDNQLKTSFINTADNVIGTITLDEFQLNEQLDLAVYNVSTLLKLVSALDNDIDINIKKADSKTAVQLNISDDKTDVTYILSDLQLIRNTPSNKILPEFDIKIKLDADFNAMFKKAMNAIPESENFAIKSNGIDTNIIINYSSIETNRVTYKVNTIQSNEMPITCFAAKVFRDILNNNTGDGLLEISSAGLAKITFSTINNITAEYFLIKLALS